MKYTTKYGINHINRLPRKIQASSSDATMLASSSLPVIAALCSDALNQLHGGLDDQDVLLSFVSRFTASSFKFFKDIKEEWTRLDMQDGDSFWDIVDPYQASFEAEYRLLELLVGRGHYPTQWEIWVIALINNVLTCCSKDESICMVDDDDFKQDFLQRNQEILAIEESIPGLCLDELNRLFRYDLRNFRITEFLGHHGPGTTANGSRLKNKWGGVWRLHPYLLEPFFRDGLVDSIAPIVGRKSKLDVTNKVYAVPKAIDSRRIICAEPSGLMFLEQAVKEALYPWIDRHFSQITLTDQSVNQRMALQGSADGSYATLDLSKASDSISYRIVAEGFRGTPICKYLMRLRSQYTSVNDESYKLNLWASMGNAMTFPIETLLFREIVELAVCWQDGYRHHVDYHIFGDDIVVPERYFTSVVSLINSFGFSVSMSKTFHGSMKYRESCGIEAYNGYDVTPIRVKNNVFDCTPSALIGKINQAGSKGLTIFRAYLLEVMRERQITCSFSDVDSGDLVHSYHSDPFSRWSTDYQRNLVARTGLFKKYEPQPQKAALFEWFSQAALRGYSCEPIVTSVRPTGSPYLKTFWS